MKKIDVTALIQKNNLDAKDLASKLFPTHQHPTLALTRIIQGKSVLDANQISLLSELTGQTINSLFDLSEWEASSTDKILVFKSGDFTAELDMAKGLSKIYHKNSVFHETILHSLSIPLSDYLSEVTAAVVKFNNKK